MKPSCPSLADSPGTPNGSGKASLLQCVSVNVKTNVTWYPSMPFVAAITAVDHAWCFVSAVSSSAALTKQDLLAEEPGKGRGPTLPAALWYFFLLWVILSLWIWKLGMQHKKKSEKSGLNVVPLPEWNVWDYFHIWKKEKKSQTQNTLWASEEQHHQSTK